MSEKRRISLFEFKRTQAPHHRYYERKSKSRDQQRNSQLLILASVSHKASAEAISGQLPPGVTTSVPLRNPTMFTAIWQILDTFPFKKWGTSLNRAESAHTAKARIDDGLDLS